MKRKNLSCIGSDQRGGCERRADDKGPPNGWRDRRRMVERRLPAVHEDEISQKEWFRRMASYLAQRRAEKRAMAEAYATLEALTGKP